MNTLLISYDLRKKRDYEKIHNAIEKLGKWAKILESTWAVVTSKTTGEARDFLKLHLDSDDGLFVAKSSGSAAWSNVLCTNEWLKENL